MKKLILFALLGFLGLGQMMAQPITKRTLIYEVTADPNTITGLQDQVGYEEGILAYNKADGNWYDFDSSRDAGSRWQIFSSPIPLTTIEISGHEITYIDEEGNPTVLNIPQETVTSLSLSGNTLTYNDENGDPNEIVLPTGSETLTTLSIAGNTLTYVDESMVSHDIALPQGSETLTTLVQNPDGTYTYTSEGNVQTTFFGEDETLTSLSIAGNILTYNDENGDANALTLPQETVTSISILGNVITYNDENSVPTELILPSDILTSLSLSGNVLTYVDEAGNDTNLSLPSDVLTSLTLLGNTLTYNDENGIPNNIQLPTETLTSITINGNQITYLDENTNPTTLNLPVHTPSTITNPLPTGHLIGIHNNGDGQITNLQETITTLSADGSDLEYVNESGQTMTVDMTQFGSDDQTISIDNGNLSIEDGNTVDLSLLNTDEQDLTLTGTFLSIEHGNSVDLSPLLSDLQPVVTGGHTIATHAVAGGSLQNIQETVTSLTLSGTNLTYSDETGSGSVLNLAGINTDDQTLSLNGTVISIESANSIDIGPLIPAASTYTNAVSNPVFRNQIGTHTAGGVNTPVYETVTSLFIGANDVLTFTRESGDFDVYDMSVYRNGTSVLTPQTPPNQPNGSPLVQRTIAVHDDGDGTTQDIQESVTELQLFNNTNLIYTDENAVEHNLDLTNIPAGISVFSNQNTNAAQRTIATHTSGDNTVFNIRESVTKLLYNSGTNVLSYTDEHGSTVDWTLSGTGGGGGSTSVVDQTVAGNRIARHQDGAGTAVDINETVTSLSLSGAILTYTDEAGNDTDLTLPTGGGGGATSSMTNTVAGHRIGTHNNGAGNSVDIDETVTSLSLSGSVLTYTDENGDDFDITLPSGGGGAVSSMTQTVSTGNPIAVHSDGQGTDVTIFETVTSISVSGTNLAYTDENGTTTNHTLPSGGGGGGAFGAQTVSLTSAGQTVNHAGNDYQFIELVVSTNVATAIINESMSNGSVMEIWAHRFPTEVELSSGSFRSGNNNFFSTLNLALGETARMTKISGSWVVTYQGQQ